MNDDSVFDQMKAHASLYKKLATVMGSLKRLPKTGENAHFKYKFATDADVADAVREKLAESGVAFFASMVSEEREGTRTTVVFEFTFADSETGATITSRWVGEAIDGQDKGLSKAATAAEKYFLLKTFMLSTGDSADDPDSGDADGGKPKGSQRPQVARGPQQRPPVASAAQAAGATGMAKREPPTDTGEKPWKEVYAAFLSDWNAKGVTNEVLLDALKIGRWGEWTGTRKEADAKVTAYLAAQPQVA